MDTAHVFKRLRASFLRLFFVRLPKSHPWHTWLHWQPPPVPASTAASDDPLAAKQPGSPGEASSAGDDPTLPREFTIAYFTKPPVSPLQAAPPVRPCDPNSSLSRRYVHYTKEFLWLVIQTRSHTYGRVGDFLVTIFFSSLCIYWTLSKVWAHYPISTYDEALFFSAPVLYAVALFNFLFHKRISPAGWETFPIRLKRVFIIGFVIPGFLLSFASVYRLHAYLRSHGDPFEPGLVELLFPQPAPAIPPRHPRPSPKP